MGIPAIVQPWTISANNHYVFSSVLGAMQALAFSIKGFLKTTMGLTVKGSCTAGTGAMDGTDRWASAADVTPRGNGSATSQAWFVFTDGAGVDICLSFNSSTDDVFRLAHSPGGLYVAAGTANQQPTATDECPSGVSSASASWVATTASGDRIWHLWGTQDKKCWRMTLGRLNVFLSMVGTERIVSSVRAPISFVGFEPAVNFYFSSAAIGSASGSTVGASSASTGGRTARIHVNGADANVLAGGCGEGFFGGMGGTTFNVERTDLQGSIGDLLYPLGCASAATGASGKMGNHLDWWFTYSNAVVTWGDVFGNFQLFAAGEGIVLPWDGSTVPVTL